MTTHWTHTKYNEGNAFTTDITGHALRTDTGHDDGGADSGPSPKRLMLASLAGCTGIDVVSILNKMKVPFSDFSIDVHAVLTKDHPKIYNFVKINYKIKVAEEDKPKMVKAVSLSQETYCGVAAMFRTFAKLDTEIDFIG
ncbi:MAG: OsmC family protein [Chitinophagaceae bacterium]